MRIVYFTHSLVSCWNHGNAHFIRGLLGEFGRRGHDVTAWEPQDGWSRQSLVRDHGEMPLRRFDAQFPDLDVRIYGPAPDVSVMLAGADLVIVHEWTDPALVAAIGMLRKRGARFVLLFHDTHHRAVSEADAMRRLDLSGYDAVLAFGRSLAEIYQRMGWGSRAHVFHEAADTRVFRPRETAAAREGVVWVGNWGDEERSAEIAEFLLRPAQAAGVGLDVYGVRYPQAALQALEDHGARYHGWIANTDVPALFSRHAMTIHIPRRQYARMLPGIPTIRMFEALACGIPLISAPWDDAECLFRPGEDYLIAHDGTEMAQAMRRLAADSDLRAALARSGLERIRARHTCAHRADQLLTIALRYRATLAGAA